MLQPLGGGGLEYDAGVTSEEICGFFASLLPFEKSYRDSDKRSARPPGEMLKQKLDEWSAASSR